jgi:hypothetical protein
MHVALANPWILCCLLAFSHKNTNADLTCNVDSEDGSMVKKIVDPEAGPVAAAPTKHYVPFLELFRGHWLGIIIQACYEACEYYRYQLVFDPTVVCFDCRCVAACCRVCAAV